MENAKHDEQRAECKSLADTIAKATAADSFEADPVSRVLVLYTGGTIGMKSNPNGGLYEAQWPKQKSMMQWPMWTFSMFCRFLLI